MTDLDDFQALKTKITDQAPRHRLLNSYYNGALRLAALGLSLPPEMRKLQTVVNWPRLTADALEERLDLIAFRMGGATEVDGRLWEWWQANGLDEESGLEHLESLVQGIGFVTVGYDEARTDTPRIVCESAAHMTAEVDPRTHLVKKAARLYDWTPDGEARAGVLYQLNKTIYLKQHNGRWIVDPDLGIDEHGYDRVPVVPFVNKARIADRGGRSEMTDVMGITDACCRAVTNLQGAQELMALPSRYVFGIDENDMKDRDGNPVAKWEAYLGRYNTLGDKDAKVVQLPAADLRNFSEAVNLYARQVASLTGMPPHWVGLSTDNPASADAIRSGEARHVKRAERKCRVFGGAWEEVMRLGMLVVDGEVPDEANSMESLWNDPATPTFSSKVDAVVKLRGAGLMPREAAWEELGYGPTKIEHLRALAAQEGDPLQQLADSVGLGGNRPGTTASATAAAIPQPTLPANAGGPDQAGA